MTYFDFWHGDDIVKGFGITFFEYAWSGMVLMGQKIQINCKKIFFLIEMTQ